MKKFLTTFLCVFVLIFGTLNAQEKATVPPYEGFALGGYLNNQYGLGSWADFLIASGGAGIVGEYTLPAELPAGLGLGFSLHFDYAHFFPKPNSTLARGYDLFLTPGFWLRIPFGSGNAQFAFQPELGYTVFFHNIDGQNGSLAHGWYIDQAFMFAAAFRYVVPAGGYRLELDLAPLYTMAVEKGQLLNQIGFRFGVLWHFMKDAAN